MSSQYNSDLTADMARLGEPSSVEENNRLHRLVAAGDADARRQMIEGNMPLVVAKVNAYLIEFPHLAYLRDDLTSAGFVGLVDAVNKLATGRKSRNPTAYIGVAINCNLRQLLENEAPIRVPQESQRLAKAQGKEITVPPVVNTMPDHCCLSVAPQAQKVEARDLLRCCCKDKRERLILRLCEEGRSYEHVGKCVNLGHVTVRRILKRILGRYDKKRNQHRTSA